MRRLDDAGVVSPIPVVLVAVASTIFMALLVSDLTEGATFPDFTDGPTERDCSAEGGLDALACPFVAVWEFISDVFRLIVAVVIFLFRVVTFDIPGAPWPVRAIVTTAIGGAIVWSTAGLFRGN
jgi:hypothetical protein